LITYTTKGITLNKQNNNVPISSTSVDDTIKYFTQEEWGNIYEDDKYWDDEDLFGNFIIFVAYCFAWLGLPRPTYNQFMLAKHLEDTSNPYRMVMGMRGISKSLHAQLYTVWRLYRDPDQHILVMSASGGRASNFTSFVQKVIKLIPCTQHMAPRHNKERTSGSSFDVAGAMESDSPSVYAVGVENQIAGFRATLVIYDDIETKQNSTSIVMREKVDYYAKEAHNLLMAGSKETITLCTPHSKDSVYMGWIAEGHVPLVIPSEYVGKEHFLYKYIAKHIKDRVEKFPSLIGKATDERINDDELESTRMKIGLSEYKLQYMLDVSESDDLKHPLKLSDLVVTDILPDDSPIKIGYSSMPENQLYIKHNGFKGDKIYKSSYHSDERAPYQTRIMSVDPSGRGKDETAYCIIYILAGKIFLKEIGGFAGGYDDDSLLQLAKIGGQHNVEYFVNETNFGDGSFARMFEPYMNKYMPKAERVDIRSTKQKELRIINTLEPLLNQHKIIVDKEVFDRDIRALAPNSFTYQISHVTRERDCLKADDRLDCFEMAVSYAVEEHMDVDEDRIMSINKEKEMEEIMKMTNELFRGSMFGVQRNLNLADNF